MERAARVVNKSKTTSKILSESEVARAIWPVAVGKLIASHTGRIRVVRSTLVVEVEDATWQQQLNKLQSQILDRLQKVTGSDAITDLEFRVGIPRREPQRAETVRGSLFEADEAEEIADAVLKKVYRLSRKKATA